MALDVYVGPLTLYYAGQWENLAQKYARERGAHYQIIRPDKVEDSVKDPELIRPAIVGRR